MNSYRILKCITIESLCFDDVLAVFLVNVQVLQRGDLHHLGITGFLLKGRNYYCTFSKTSLLKCQYRWTPAADLSPGQTAPNTQT